MDVNSKKWSKRFLSLAHHIASWSKDPSTKVGAYIVDSLGKPVSHGYNGFARGVNDSDDRLNNRDIKYKFVAHAERNALDQATRHDLSDCILFCTHYPCSNCAIGIIQKGIKTVIVDSSNFIDSDSDFSKRFSEEHKITKTMFDEAGVRVISVNHEDKK